MEDKEAPKPPPPPVYYLPPVELQDDYADWCEKTILSDQSEWDT